MLRGFISSKENGNREQNTITIIIAIITVYHIYHYNPYNEIYTVLQNNDYLRFINSLSSESFQNKFM